MKTKTFVMLCLLLGIGLTQISAQAPLPANGKTGTVSWWRVWDGYWQPVYCDGVLVDDLSGTVTAHNIEFYRDGFMVSAIMHYYGQVVSLRTGEVFKLNEIDKADNIDGNVTWHFNLNGDKGNHYIGWMRWDFVNDPVPLKAQCN